MPQADSTSLAHITVTPLLILAVVAASGISVMGANLQPLIVGSTMDGLGLTESQAGLAAMVEMLAMAAASLLIAPRLERMSRRRLIIAGGGIALCGYAGSALSSAYAGLLMARLVAGVGEGTVMAAGNSAVALTRDPDRTWAFVSIVGAGLSGLLLAALPVVVLWRGYAGLFCAVIVLDCLLLPFALRLPTRGDSNTRERRTPLPHVGLGLAVICSAFLMDVGQFAIWSFTERMGRAAGIAPHHIGFALGAGAVVGVSGAGLAAWLSTRFGRAVPLIVGLTGSALGALGVIHAEALPGYTGSVALWYVSYLFVVPYLLGTAAMLDPIGRWSAATAAMAMIGIAVGPGIGGWMVHRWGFGALGFMVIASCAMCLTLMLFVSYRLASQRAFSSVLSSGNS